MELDFATLWPLLLGLAAGGVVMGFMAGLLGIGGGAIIVPILYEIFRVWGVPEDLRLKLATGTSLAIMLPTTFRSYRGHSARGAVDFRVVNRLAVPLVLGVVGGVLVAKDSGANLFKTVWITFSIVMGTNLLLGDRGWRLGTDIPRSRFFELYGTFVGLLSTLLSIGGGAFITVMMRLFGRPITEGIGTASAFGPMITIPGAIGFMWAGWGAASLPPLSAGFVSLPGFAVAATMSVMTAPYGVKVAHKLQRRTLELLFATFLFLVAFRFLFSLAAH